MRQVTFLRSRAWRTAGPGAALIALLLAAAAPALAKRVAVAPFEGPQADAAEKAVVAVLIKEGHEVVSTDEWKAVVAEVGRKATAEEAIAAAAKKVRVSAVVLGTIQPPGKRGKPGALMIVVHDGKTGNRLEGIEVPLKRGRLDAAATTTIALNLPPVIPLGQDPVEEKVAVQAPTDADTPEALAARRAARAAASQPVKAPVERKRTIAVAGVGINLWGRNMAPTPGGSSDAYDGGPMPPGLHLEVEGYPVAKFKQGVLGDIGIAGYFGYTRFITKYPNAGGADTNVGTTYMRGGVDLRFRHTFMPDNPWGPTVRGAIAFNYVGFKLSAAGRAGAGNITLSDASLFGVGPVVGVVVPLGRPWLRAGASFGGFYVTGPDSNAPSQNYGGGWAIDTTVHVDWLPLRWLQVRAQVGVAHYGASVDAATYSTTALADTYFTGLITASYVY
jgi:hypothetical protein